MAAARDIDYQVPFCNTAAAAVLALATLEGPLLPESFFSHLICEIHLKIRSRSVAICEINNAGKTAKR